MSDQETCREGEERGLPRRRIELSEWPSSGAIPGWPRSAPPTLEAGHRSGRADGPSSGVAGQDGGAAGQGGGAAGQCVWAAGQDRRAAGQDGGAAGQGGGAGAGTGSGLQDLAGDHGAGHDLQDGGQRSLWPGPERSYLQMLHLRELGLGRLANGRSAQVFEEGFRNIVLKVFFYPSPRCSSSSSLALRLDHTQTLCIALCFSPSY